MIYLENQHVIKPTCYSPVGQPSLIDYCIVDVNLFKKILYFKVNNLLPVSIHCAISFSLHISKEYHKLPTDPDSDAVLENCIEYIWDSDSTQKYQHFK